MKAPAGERKVYLDLLRIVACILVIFNHILVSVAQFRLHPLFWYLFAFSKMAVPLFVLVSGAVLLPKEDSYQKSFSRVLRIVLTLLLFTLLYYGRACVKEGIPFNFGKYFYLVYNDRATNAYWYLYLYLGILLMLPMMQKLVRHFQSRDFRYLIFFSVIVMGVMPILTRWDARFQYNDSINTAIFSVYLGLLAAGYYLDAFVPYGTGKWILAWLGAAGMTALSARLCIHEDSFAFYENCELLNVTATAICCFYGVKWAMEKAKLPEGAARFLSACGRLTFCTYLLGDLLIEIILPLLPMEDYTPLAAGLLTLLVFVCGMLLSALLTRVPLLKKLLS